MNLAEARSYSDGIDFYVRDGGIVISGRRLPDGKTKVSVSKYSSKKPLKTREGSVMAVLFAIYLAFGGILIKDLPVMIKMLFYISSIWGFILFYYRRQASKLDRKVVHRYHAAEHKVLNYYEKHNMMTMDLNALKKTSSISYRCGSTIIAVVMILATLTILGGVLLPYWVFKIIWFGVSVYITLKLWANGYCNFLQRCVIAEPTNVELELAAKTAWQYQIYKTLRKSTKEK